jgi:hypothetical protein
MNAPHWQIGRVFGSQAISRQISNAIRLAAEGTRTHETCLNATPEPLEMIKQYHRFFPVVPRPILAQAGLGGKPGLDSHSKVILIWALGGCRAEFEEASRIGHLSAVPLWPPRHHVFEKLNGFEAPVLSPADIIRHAPRPRWEMTKANSGSMGRRIVAGLCLPAATRAA